MKDKSLSPLAPSRPSDVVDAAVNAAYPLVSQAMAVRISKNPAALRDYVAVITDSGTSLGNRTDVQDVLREHAGLASLAEGLGAAPPKDCMWVLYLRADQGAAPTIRPLHLDRRRLSVKRPLTLEQEQLLDAFLQAATPNVLTAVEGYRKAHPKDELEVLAVYLHDSGPGVIPLERLRQILTDHGFHSDAEALRTTAPAQHLWVWVSTWQSGGTAGLRQLSLAAPPVLRVSC